jgi:hypothetical protein
VTSQALREQKTSPREFMPDKENGSMQQLWFRLLRIYEVPYYLEDSQGQLRKGSIRENQRFCNPLKAETGRCRILLLKWPYVYLQVGVFWEI